MIKKKSRRSLQVLGLAPVILLLFCTVLSGCTQAYLSGQKGIAESLTHPLELIPAGEELHYEISWWGAPVANAVVVSRAAENGLVELDLKGRSNWYLEAFYPVRVAMKSLVDPKTAAPQKFEAYVKRRWKVHKSTVTFDWESMQASHELPKGKSATVDITKETQDGLSLVYYARTIPFRLGEILPLRITADGKNWDLKGKIVRAHLIRIGRLGKWPAVEGELELAYPVPFFHGAKARVWYSADKQRIPLLAKLHSRIGPVTVVLTNRKVSESPAP
jgi:hypothetical protein